ncbi:putative long-chain-fatty-acid--CoA ligase [metagenome]|uniref:Putative long-chain-fatty-acid--CoA ligase n=1 Tax=metagenome TaxID=256318 RepID=A0A2P2C8N3_9ZZZZ
MWSTVYPVDIAREHPERIAMIEAETGASITYAALAARVNQVGHVFRAHGLGPGSHVAIVIDNVIAFAEISWAAHMSGILLTPVNNRLTAAEIGYIVNDSGAEAVISTSAYAETMQRLDAEGVPNVRLRLMVGEPVEGWASYEVERDRQSTDPIADQCRGGFMHYSSGTTGQPKGITQAFTVEPLYEDNSIAMADPRHAGLGELETVLVPGPLFHSAPSWWMYFLMSSGATIVLMQGYDPEKALQLIERHQVTFVQFVPTHMVRLLRLPHECRQGYDVSSLKSVVHAAAPCPVEVKRTMIDWLGPILHEYYSSTECPGTTWINSAEWLTHQGSVGRSVTGAIHILDDDGNELPLGEPGLVYFETSWKFEYHNDPDKTREAFTQEGYATTGDVGYLDQEGYLYLTDRKSHMIISGGMNIYPQEAENVLAAHADVADVAVIGVPNPDMGEEVKAIVQPVDWSRAGDELAAELMAHCRSRIAGYKCPRTIEFRRELPRTESGKLFKRLLRDEFAEAARTAATL